MVCCLVWKRNETKHTRTRIYNMRARPHTQTHFFHTRVFFHVSTHKKVTNYFQSMWELLPIAKMRSYRVHCVVGTEWINGTDKRDESYCASQTQGVQWLVLNGAISKAHRNANVEGSESNHEQMKLAVVADGHSLTPRPRSGLYLFPGNHRTIGPHPESCRYTQGHYYIGNRESAGKLSVERLVGSWRWSVIVVLLNPAKSQQ